MVVHGQPALQQAIRWNLFQVAQATARRAVRGPSKGVTGTGYSGHYFWDTEIFVLPFLTYTSPQMARSELRFRYNMLGAARRRAEELAQSGALFPWRTVNGEEASAYYAAGTAQYHIDADIAYALCKYVAASGDQDFMNREGVDLLVETARLWADLGFWRENGTGRRSFHIHGVTGPDEYTTVVNDNLFTNVMARFNLAKAAEYSVSCSASSLVHTSVVERLELGAEEIDDEPPVRRRCRSRTTRSRDQPQDAHFLIEIWDLENTPADKRPCSFTITPGDLPVPGAEASRCGAGLVLQVAISPMSRSATTSSSGPQQPATPLSGIVQSIIAAEVGYQGLALRYFYNALFVDLADLHGNTRTGSMWHRRQASGTSSPTGSAGCGTTTGSSLSTLACLNRGPATRSRSRPRHPRKGRGHQPRDRLHSRRRRGLASWAFVANASPLPAGGAFHWPTQACVSRARCPRDSRSTAGWDADHCLRAAGRHIGPIAQPSKSTSASWQLAAACSASTMGTW